MGTMSENTSGVDPSDELPYPSWVAEMRSAMKALEEQNQAVVALYRARRGQLLGYARCFLGECMGVGLAPHGADDPRVHVVLLVEDDTFWHRWADNGRCGVDSAWLGELNEKLFKARVWLNRYTDEGPHGFRFTERQMKRWREHQPEVERLQRLLADDESIVEATNANLIAPASDLLAACERFERLVREGYDMWIRDEDGGETYDLTPEFADALVMAQAALANATGER